MLKMVRTYDTTHQVFYAPSFQEQKALEAVSRGDDKNAELWFDRAIFADPTRGPRIYSQCMQLKSPMERHYYRFSVAPGHNTKEDFRWALSNVCLRLIKDPKQAQVCTEELMKDLHFWDEPAAQTSGNIAPLKSTSQHAGETKE
jgi:hypothetical protein